MTVIYNPGDLPPFQVAPPRELDEHALMPTPDDHRLIFIVTSGLYADRRNVAAFTGNRYAAISWVAEFDRYADEDDETELQQWPDPVLYNSDCLARDYPDWYTEVEYRTYVATRMSREFIDGKADHPWVVTHSRPVTHVKAVPSTLDYSEADDDAVTTELNSSSGLIVVTTTAPDRLNDAARVQHARHLSNVLTLAQEGHAK